MNAIKIRSRKALKFLGLLISAMVIATVSAQVYRYMYIDGTVTVGSAKLIWIKGASAPADATIDGSTVTMDLDVEPGTPQNFTECLFLKNNDTVAHNLTVRVTTTVSATFFDGFNIYIYENATASPAWTLVDILDVTISDSYETYTGNEPLGADGYYLMLFEVAPDSTASGTYSFDIEVEYE
jgi:hypothetical protein